jgi:hypothetical protein
MFSLSLHSLEAKMLCATLRSVQKNYVDFDPFIKEHLTAFKMLCVGELRGAHYHIRQHPILRFNLEAGFDDVRSMMLHKVANQYLRIMSN